MKEKLSSYINTTPFYYWMGKRIYNKTWWSIIAITIFIKKGKIKMNLIVKLIIFISIIIPSICTMAMPKPGAEANGSSSGLMHNIGITLGVGVILLIVILVYTSLFKNRNKKE